MEFVEHVKSSVDIARVVGEYVRLRKAGPTRWVGLCPFHTEKTPSFGVNTAHQFYKCFGCGAGGDLIKFVMEIESLTFWEALKLLAERNGIPLPKRSEYADEDSKLRGAIYEMHEQAQKAYQAALESSAGAEARAYLERRGVKPELAEEFGLGLSERSGQFLVRRFQGFSEEALEASGLVKKRESGGYYDSFRGRLMFPIQNESGKIVAFAGRALAAEDEPKYLNSAATPIYQKSSVLYNLHRAKSAIRAADQSILVEGYMDVIGLAGAGVRQAVASCGTALTSNQVRVLRRHSGNVAVNFDPDAAGAAATERSIQILLEEALHIRIVELEEGLDPDEFVKKYGVGEYQTRLEKAARYFLWLAERARKKFDVKTAEGRAAVFQSLLPAIQRIPDKIERVGLVNDVAGYLGLDTGLVLEQFRKAAADRKTSPIKAPRPQLPKMERILLRCLLESEEARLEVLSRLKEPAVAEKLQARKIFEAIGALEDRFSYGALEARLEEADRDLLASMVFADEVSETKISVEQAVACLSQLDAELRTSERTALKSRIREAEQAGNLAEAFGFTEQLRKLEKG